MPFTKGNKINVGRKVSALTKRKMSKAAKERVAKFPHTIPDNTDERNGSWKGDEVGYIAIHDWVRRRLGKPRFCARCESTTEKRYEWANISGEYRRDLNDYVRLCKRCHNLFDNINEKRMNTMREMGLIQ